MVLLLGAILDGEGVGQADPFHDAAELGVGDDQCQPRVGIVGISGFGGGEAMRLVASHPSFELIYAAGEGSAGTRLVDRFPGVPAKLAELVIEKWDPETLPKLRTTARTPSAPARRSA